MVIFYKYNINFNDYNIICLICVYFTEIIYKL